MVLFEHKVLGDHRGNLVAIESNVNVPFDIERVFYIFGVHAEIPRGNHAHFETKQYLIALNGSCAVTLDDGKRKDTYLLDKPNVGLFQDAMVWGTMHDFSSDCVLLVMANNAYQDSDYIRDYHVFLKEVNS